MDTTRAFIAIPVSEPAASKLVRLCTQMSSTLEQVRWTPRDQLHLTVKFLGDVDNRELPTICRTLADCCAQVEPMRIGLKGLGTFPAGKPPRVIWAGVDAGREELRELHERIDTQFESIGLPREARKFTPHLTLGRVSKSMDPGRIEDAMKQYGTEWSSEFEVDEVLLLASERRHGQIVYEPIDHVEL